MKQAYTIKPQTAVASPDSSTTDFMFPIELVAPVVGMAHSFIKRALGRKSILSETDVRKLLDQDAFSETFVPRSNLPGFSAPNLELLDFRQFSLFRLWVAEGV